MRTDEHVDVLEAEGVRTAALARANDPDADVPGCPGWTARDVLAHIGDVHRWTTKIVTERLASLPQLVDTSAEVPSDSGELVEWYLEGNRELVSALRSAPADLDCATLFGTAPPLAFWARRQALEASIHRADVEAAAGRTPSFDATVAIDGITEVLSDFGLRPRRVVAATYLIEVEDGPSWFVAVAPGEVIDTRPAIPGDTADAAIRGSASDVYLWTWNRPAKVTITGDDEAAAMWKNIRIRRGG